MGCLDPLYTPLATDLMSAIELVGVDAPVVHTAPERVPLETDLHAGHSLLHGGVEHLRAGLLHMHPELGVHSAGGCIGMWDMGFWA